MHQPQALVAKGGWLLRGRRGARKEPCSTSGHPVAVQNAAKRRGERPVLGKGEAAQLAATGGETLLQKRRSDLEPWRKQTGKPLSIDQAVFYNWFTLKLWWPEEAHARLMGCLQQSMLPLPSHHRYQGQDKRRVAQQSYLLSTGFSPTGLHSHLCRGRGGGGAELQRKRGRQWDQLMLPSATGRLQRLQSALGWEIPRGKVKSSRIWLPEAPALQMLGRNCQTSPFLPPTALQQWGLKIAGRPPLLLHLQLPPLQPLVWSRTGQLRALAPGHPLSLWEKPRAQKPREKRG